MSHDKERAAIEAFILESLKEIEYGSLEIIIHDSRIVQIEKSVKRRFDK